MIQVEIWWASVNGNSVTPYLVDVGPEPFSLEADRPYFDSEYGRIAVVRSLSEFCKTHPRCRIEQIKISSTAGTVLKP